MCSSVLMACAAPPHPDEEWSQEPQQEVIVETNETIDADASTPPEQGKEAEPTIEKEPLPEPEQIPEPIVETEPDIPEAPPEPPEPTQCQSKEACNAPLDQDGKCPGTCIPQDNELTCRGTVQNGLCYSTPPTATNKPATIQGILFEPGTIPSIVIEGETKTFTIKATNTTNKPVSLPFTYSMDLSWKLIDASFKNLKSLDFKANEVKTLTMDLQGNQANVFTTGLTGGFAINFSFNRDRFSIGSLIGYPATGNVACGQHYFPAKYCPSSPCSRNRRHYNSGVCCNQVFYPGAQCCTSSDCNEGSCFQGICVSTKPRSLANTLPTGHERILVVLSDFTDIPHEPKKVCTNRITEFKTRLKIPEFEKYYNELSQRYTKRPAPKYEWTVFAGINMADFNPNGSKTARGTHAALRLYLAEKGCIKSEKDFDKILIISSQLDLNGFTGYALTEGRVSQKKIDMYLFAHELTHTYGAQDLYLNLGGKLQYLHDLMGNNLGRYGKPIFGVSWGEIMWGDTNQNGVIDVFEFAIYPEKLISTNHHAKLTNRNTIEVGLDIAAMENGQQKRLLLKEYKVELPDYKASAPSWPGRTIVFDSQQVDLADVRKKGTIKIRAIAEYIYTDKQFARKKLILSEDKVINVTP